MSDAQRNFAAILDLLQEHDVHVIETEHDHDYSRGGDHVRFTLSVDVPKYAKSELREEREHRLAGAKPNTQPTDENPTDE